jgi:uncharacterized BrkB/YihY/UPF0761 family membrane protein
MRPMSATQEPEAPAPAGGSAVDGRPPGRIKRSVAWSKTNAEKAGVWAVGAREQHASVDVGFRFRDRDRQVAAMVLAGGIAYRIFFWLLALSLVASGIISYFDPTAVEDAARNQGLGPGVASALGKLANSSGSNGWWLILLGSYLVLWTGYTCAKTLVLTHAAIWGVPPPRVGRPLRASLVFTGGTLAFIVAMWGARWVREQETALGLLATLLVFALPCAFWLLATHKLPHRAAGWLDLLPGAVVVAVGMQAMHIFTAYFLGPKLTSATQLYGVIGIATTTLFWFYIAGRLIIAAATLNASLVERRAPDDGASASG